MRASVKHFQLQDAKAQGKRERFRVSQCRHPNATQQNNYLPAKDFALGGVCLYEEQIKNNKTMKARRLLPALLVALSLASAIGQPQPAPPPAVLPPGYPSAVPPRALSQPEPPKLTTFNLDFPGGTPQQLVTAIEKAGGMTLNVIIPVEHADFKLPPLKMNNVNVEQLFKALEATGRKSEAYVSPGQMGSYQIMNTSYGFRTPGPQSDDSIWYFYVEKPVRPPQVTPVVPKVCRFYALTSYLEHGLTVEDITTAIQTGWKMLGDQETPTISFHKETKLLIAVGELAKLETIDAVLKALTPTPETFSDRINAQIRDAAKKSAVGGSSPPPPPKPAEKPKTEN